MTKTPTIDSNVLAEEAKASKNKESYRLLEKTQNYRIGVGARAESADVSFFFVEVVLVLSSGSNNVSLPRLEKALRCLKRLQTRGYLLNYEDDNTVSCEKSGSFNLNEEYSTVKPQLELAFK